MTQRPDAHKVCTVDIETYGGSTKPTIKDVSVPGNYTNPDTIKAYIDKTLPTLHNKQALNSVKGEIICIGLAIGEEPVEVLYRNLSEDELMKQFSTWLMDNGMDKVPVTWVGGNIEGFDLPWMAQRAWKYNLPLITKLIPAGRYDERIVDIIRLFSGTDYQTHHKVDDIAKFFGLGGKTGLPSEDVPQAYLDGRHEEIAARCGEDVDIERAIAKILVPWIF